jgi:hypothetical protein
MGAIARLRDGFTGAVAATTLFAASACAAQDDTARATPVSFNTEVAANTEVEVENLIGPELSRRDAFRASTDQIVLHVGDGMRGIEAQVVSLQNDGYRVSAFHGSEPGQVECFVNNRRCGVYGQDQVFDATMSGTASIIYDERLGEPTRSSTSLASLNR